MFLHLLFIFNFGINALPISINITDNHNSTTNVIFSNKSLENLNMSLIIANIKIPKDFNLTEVAKNLQLFGINHLKDDTHIKGLPLNRRGKINPNFHKEIFLGDHKLFQNNKRKTKKKFEEILNEADHDHDERLSHKELFNYVIKNVQQHLRQAKDKNSQLFLLIDSNNNGKITWQEYSALYVKFHHMNESDIKDFDDIDFIQESFDENLQRELLKIRYRWTTADGGEDNELNLDEFLAFRHPEITDRSFKHVVDEIFLQMDLDNDLKLNEKEFIYLPSAMSNTQQLTEGEQRWIEHQKIEFQEMDEDNDGFLSRDELLHAYDPFNRSYINIQIKSLFSKVDDAPKDNYLSLNEIEKHIDVFSNLPILDNIKMLHNEN